MWIPGMLHLGIAPFSPFKGLDARHAANKYPTAKILNIYKKKRNTETFSPLPFSPPPSSPLRRRLPSPSLKPLSFQPFLVFNERFYICSRKYILTFSNCHNISSSFISIKLFI